jgi:hypothetical protein
VNILCSRYVLVRTQPAAYLKILALLVPREHKVEHSNALKNLTDEQLEAMIEYIKSSLEAQAGGSVRVIEGTIEPVAATAPAPKPKNRLMLEADTAVGPSERHRASGADLHRAKLPTRQTSPPKIAESAWATSTRAVTAITANVIAMPVLRSL